MVASSSPAAAVAALFSSKSPSLLISKAELIMPQIKFKPQKPQFLSVKCAADSTAIVDNAPGPSASTNNSIRSDGNLDDKAVQASSKIGSSVRVKVPLKVYHVPKVPEFDLGGRIGVLKQYVAVRKGKPISASLPYKVEFVVEGLDGREKPVKFFAHLREDEFEFLD